MIQVTLGNYYVLLLSVFCTLFYLTGGITAPDNMENLLKPDGEEECSFLKIENVVSLAPSVDNDSVESPIVSDR